MAVLHLFDDALVTAFAMERLMRKNTTEGRGPSIQNCHKIGPDEQGRKLREFQKGQPLLA